MARYRQSGFDRAAAARTNYDFPNGTTADHVVIGVPHKQTPHHNPRLGGHAGGGPRISIPILVYLLLLVTVFDFIFLTTRDHIGSAYMVGRTLTSVFWGVIADRYGRKVVMIVSTLGIVIFNTLFGLSTSYWMAMSTRFFLGALCGVLGPLRAYCTEVCRTEHQSLGLAMVTSSWGIGLVFGPALGGYLAQPAEVYPTVFSRDSIFGRFPYLLISLVISLIGLCVTVLCFWLPETLHKHPEHGKIQDLSSDIEDVAVSMLCDDEKLKDAEETISQNLMAVSMFVPTLILQPTFLNLTFGTALAALLVLEIIRDSVNIDTIQGKNHEVKGSKEEPKKANQKKKKRETAELFPGQKFIILGREVST